MSQDNGNLLDGAWRKHPVFDPTRLNEISGERDDLSANLLKIFLENARTQQEKALAASKQKGLETPTVAFCSALHAIKGSSANLGGERLAKLAAAIEKKVFLLCQESMDLLNKEMETLFAELERELESYNS